MPRLLLCMLALTACYSDPVALEGSPGAERLFGSLRPATRATYVGSCVGGVAPGAPGDVSLCRGEDWWLPASVAPSTEGTVTAYSAPVDEEVADPTRWTNPYTRRLSGSDPHVLIGSAVDLETGDVDYSLKRLLYNYAEYDCVDAWVDDCMDTLSLIHI